MSCRYRSAMLVLFAGWIFTVAGGGQARAIGAENLLSNPDFSQVDPSGVPSGWIRRTPEGTVKVLSENGHSLVRLEVRKPGQSSFIQQTVKLPSAARRVILSTRYRFDDIEPGGQKYQCGKVQGRFIKDGQETNGWIDLGSLRGSSQDWIERQQTADVPEGVDSVMLRLALYNVKAGRLDVARAGCRIVTEAEVAAERAEFRPGQPFGEAVTARRFARLAKGVNLSHWFAQAYNVSVEGRQGGYNAFHFDRWITERDADLIRSAGLTHVRLSVEPATFMAKDGSLAVELLPNLDKAIGLFTQRGIAVVVDVHPRGALGSDLRESEGRDRFARFWKQFAAHFSATDPDIVFLEVLNEPGGWTGEAWAALQDRLLTVIREGAPRHTIIANPGGYQLVADLVKAVPHTDRNVIYAVHYYMPSQFTHQGAVWMKDWYRPLRNVPWPIDETNLAQALRDLDRQGANAGNAAHSEKALRDMVAQGLGTRKHVAEDFDAISRWTRKYDRRVVIGEFGVYGRYAPQHSRLLWAKSVRTAAEQSGCGWTWWDYAGQFAIVKNPNDPQRRQLDTALLESLGQTGTAK